MIARPWDSVPLKLISQQHHEVMFDGVYVKNVLTGEQRHRSFGSTGIARPPIQRNLSLHQLRRRQRPDCRLHQEKLRGNSD